MIDHADDEVCHGPNRGYSLDQARANFQAHGHKYDPDHAGSHLRATGAGRAPLMAYVRAVRDGTCTLDQATLDRLIAEDREGWPLRNSPCEATEIAEEEAKLRALLDTSNG